MHLQDINNLLNFQDINIVNISNVEDGLVYITVEPKQHTQACPYCNSNHVIRRGKRGYRQVRHLSIFENITILKLPQIRMFCKSCNSSFTWNYSFVTGKSKYTDNFKNQLAEIVVGSTVTHGSRIAKTPYSTTERIFKRYLDVKVPQVEKVILTTSKKTDNLVIGIDDFAIRKGHTYNTGIHDLKNETLLHILPGRKLVDLQKDKNKFPEIYDIKPTAILMLLLKVEITK